MELQSLVDALATFGWQGLVLTAVILIGVFVARRSGLVATGDQARIANVVLSAVLFGLGDNPQSEGALMAILASVLAALAFNALDWLNKRRFAG